MTYGIGSTDLYVFIPDGFHFIRYW